MLAGQPLRVGDFPELRPFVYQQSFAGAHPYLAAGILRQGGNGVVAQPVLRGEVRFSATLAKPEAPLSRLPYSSLLVNQPWPPGQ